MRFGVLTAISLMVCSVTGADVGREGAGERRERLNEMELAPFATDTLGSLSDWTEDRPTELDGKVVLIATFASWNPTSHRALSIAQRLHRRNAEDGLVVIGVHHPEGWDGASDVLSKQKVAFPVAHDADGAFRGALLIDQDPDFYVVDRAGQLRYADVLTDSVSGAVRDLLKESVEDAENVPGAMAKAAAQADIDRRKTSRFSGGALPGQQLSVPFEAPGEEAFSEIDWPRWWVKTEYDEIAETWSTDPPTLVTSTNEEDWVPAPPAENTGKLKVLYVFDPVRPALLGAVPEMERLQRKYQRDIEVIAAAINLSAVNSGADVFSSNNNGGEEEQKLIQRNRREVGEWLRARGRGLNHTIHLGVTSVEGDLESDNAQNRTRGDDLTVALIVTTDGKIRYFGHPNVDSFKAVLPRLIELDPGAKARREAENAFLAAQRRKR